MAAQYRGVSTAVASAGVTPFNPIIIEAPSGAVAGDLLLLSLSFDGNEDVDETGDMADWTAVGSKLNNSNKHVSFCYQIGAWDGITTQWSIYLQSGTEQSVAVMVGVYGHDSGDPIFGYTENGAQDSALPASLRVTNGAGLLGVRFATCDDDDLNGSFTAPRSTVSYELTLVANLASGTGNATCSGAAAYGVGSDVNRDAESDVVWEDNGSEAWLTASEETTVRTLAIRDAVPASLPIFPHRATMEMNANLRR